MTEAANKLAKHARTIEAARRVVSGSSKPRPSERAALLRDLEELDRLIFWLERNQARIRAAVMEPAP